MKAGLNLFSIGNLIKTEEEFLETAIKLKEMGYDYMQFSGAAYDPEKIKRVVDASGLPVLLTHVALERIIDEPEKLVEEHNYFGCKNIGLGGLKNDYMLTDKTWKETLDKLNRSAEKILNAGSKFFFHNHHYEFHTFEDGVTAFDYIVNNCPFINFTLDSYWVQYAGSNPMTIVDKVKGRIDCVHLKDYRIERTITEDNKVELKPRFAPCGHGNMEMDKLVEKWKEAGAKYFFVEQDDARSYPDPLGQVKMSIDYLKTL